MFSVAPQTVTDPVSGMTITFSVDSVDTAIVRCTVGHAESNDYLRLDFQRNGFNVRNVMVDADVEADILARKAAQARLGAAPLVVAEADKKAADEAAAKQKAEDEALLASPPKVSKFTAKEKVDGPKVVAA